ncbi:MAG TPA: FAD-dependent oxidoreductase [Acidimicrobiales bacterium]|nr:FAD-dependent oxidoreductase [Acidimicrobiales bacterium]
MTDVTDVSPCERAEVTSWDDAADVVVAGFGAAGAAAAFTAADAGADVVVLERAGGAGGAAALAEGIVYLGGGTPIQRACGFEDSTEDMYRYMMAACGPDPDEAKISRYCDESLGHFDWLVERGVPFDPVFCAETSMAPQGTEGLVYSGGEDAYPFDEVARPAPRGHLAKTERATGWLLMQHLADAAAAAGARASFDTRVERLVVDDGRVVGVLAQRFGQSVAVKARRGVVLTAGGFVFNDDMMRAHCPPLVRGTFKVGTEGDDGRAIAMAQALGAAVRNMYAGEVSLPITPPRTLIHGILVNGRGQRFINEDTYMGRVGQRALYEEDGEVYLVVDEACYEVNWMGLAATWVCETAGQLEGEMGLPAGSLTSTVDLYNRHAARGEDPLFHKGARWVRPLVPPLGAFDLRVGPAPYAPFTLGGLHTTVDGAVLDVSGSAIPGLFAAGRTTAGVCAFGYASGLSIGDSTMFGRFAGRSAAMQTQ